MGCTDQIQEVAESAAPPAKLIDNTTTWYSQIPGTSRDVHSAEVIEYTDGSVEVIRSVVPYAGNQNFVRVAVSNNVPMTHSSQGSDIDFSSGDGWFVPFDPGVQAIRVTGRVIRVDCECNNGPGGCNLDVLYDPSTGKADVGCADDGNCTGNCQAHLTFSDTKLVGNGGILINATEVTAP